MLFFVISYIQLHSIHIIASVLLRCSFYHCPLFARYIIGTCPVNYRTYTGQILDKYWTNTGQILDKYRTRIEGTPLLYAYYIEAAYKIDISSSIVLHKTEHTSRKSDTSEAPNGSLSNYLFRVYIERIRTLCDIISYLTSQILRQKILKYCQITK